MSHEAINRQPFTGIQKEDNSFTFECSHYTLGDRYKTLFEKLHATKVIMCHALQLSFLTVDGRDNLVHSNFVLFTCSPHIYIFLFVYICKL